MDTTEDQPLDITPMTQGVNLLDPYELFSTPPSDMVLSSTPSKPNKGRRAPNSARKALLERQAVKNPRASISFDVNRSLNTSISKPTRVLRNRHLNKSKSADTNQNTSINCNKNNINNNNNNKRTHKETQRGRKKQPSNNLWDKCLKSNPELAQFVDNFNQSLEEALSKPLDMSGDE